MFHWSLSLLSICSWVHTPSRQQELECKTSHPTLTPKPALSMCMCVCVCVTSYLIVHSSPGLLPVSCLCPDNGQLAVIIMMVMMRRRGKKEGGGQVINTFHNPQQSLLGLLLQAIPEVLFQPLIRIALDQWLLFSWLD